MDGALTLRHGPLALTVRPGQGGACSGLTWSPPGRGPLDLWRPLPSAGEVFEAACFPLVPYSNRLFDGRLLTRAGERLLPRNHARVEHPVHGLGWRHAWRVLDRGRSHASLAYRHEADAHWPFTHSATQTITLCDRSLRMALTLKNEGATPMPAGLGFHPRFAIDAGDRVRWDAHGDRPTEHIELNDCFSGWRGAARLDRRRAGLRLRLRTGALLRHLMVYRLPGQPWLCLEPVSHATGAFSRPSMHDAAHGALELAPGRSLGGWMELRIESLASPTRPPRRRS